MTPEKLDTELILLLLKIITGLISIGLGIFIRANAKLIKRLEDGDSRFNSIDNKITGMEKDITYIRTKIKL